MISELFRRQENPIHNWAYFILGQVFIALPFSLLSFILFIDGYQPLVLLSVFVTIWVNDTGAYLVGVTFGKNRLFERISPKKSWEGFVGGALAALASGYVFSLLIPEISLLNWFIFSEIIVIFGTLGDLIESLLKRTIHVKDSGNVIPGHGGLLDRFDSMLLAAPVVFIFLSFLFEQVKK
jgi:phosphatidate cytidylyltransferase